jgi:long-chain acyl-CoA synthetase
MNFILKETNISTIFMETACMAPFVDLIESHGKSSLKNIVFMDLIPPKVFEYKLDQLSQKYGLKFWTLEQIMETGCANPHAYVKTKPSDIHTLCFTSGTTGNPKGAMVTEGNVVAGSCATELLGWVSSKERLVYLSYLPYAHCWERMNIYLYMHLRARWAVFSGDVSRIGEDCQILKPNIFNGPPRLFNKFYATIQNTIQSLENSQRTKILGIISEKIQILRATGSPFHAAYDQLPIFKQLRNILGGNVKMLFSGSAPIDPKVIELLSVVFSSAFLEGYGSTESSAFSFASRKGDVRYGTVGGCYTNTEFKLLDVPEMGYTCLDREESGKHAPRGEICMRGPGIIPGYYKNAEKTAETFTKDRFLLTGDIGTVMPDTLALKIIDRKKNIFKLSQGEYVAPDRLQNIYKNAFGIADIFVEGSGYESYLVAVVVPDEESFGKLMANSGVLGAGKMSFDQLLTHAEAQRVILGELGRVALDAKLKGFEKIKKIHIGKKGFAELDL